MTPTAAERIRRPLLVFGGSGQVGRQLQPLLAALGTVVAPARREANLTDVASLRTRIRDLRPALIVNAAALTNVDQSEREPELAFAVNGAAPGVMAEEAARVGALLVHFSTDYVFDGTNRSPYVERDEPNPINVYGASKLAGERAIARAWGAHLIVRTSWVYSAYGAGFVPTLLRQLRERDALQVVADQVGSPTWSRSLARVVAAWLGVLAHDGQFVLAEQDAGVYHLAGSGAASRVEIAEAMVDTLSERRTSADRRRPEIVPVSAAAFAAPARRPAFSALANGRIGERFGLDLAPWRADLRQMLEQDVETVR